LYDLPFVGTYTVNQGYGGLFSHTGATEYAIDWSMPIGTPVYSARDGVVVDIVDDQWLSKFDPGVCPAPVSEYCPTPGSDANTVMIRHDDGTWGLYAHLKQYSVVVTEGQAVTGKTVIAYSGNTGYSSGPHLHYQVTRASSYDNPQGWTSETLFAEFVDNTTKVWVPQVSNTYSAGTTHPAQIKALTAVPFLSYPPIVNLSSFENSTYPFTLLASVSTRTLPVFLTTVFLVLISSTSY